MLVSYTAVCFLCTVTMCVLTQLVRENDRLDDKTKRIFYGTYLVVVLSGIGDWGGMFFNGSPDSTRGIHTFMKLMDYIITPMTGICFARQVAQSNRSYKAVNAVVAFNIAFQLISVLNGWVFYLDSDNVYRRGGLYWIYIAIYTYTSLFGYMEFIRHGKRFRRRNTVSLTMTLLMLATGTVMQTCMDSVRIIYLGMTMCSVLLYIYLAEFNQIEMDDELDIKQRMIERDAMTGVFSRHAYNEALDEYSRSGAPEKLAVFVSDINGLKAINDRLGHSAGDEVIRAVASCLSETFKDTGRCFRTGGDEFVVFAQITGEQAEVAAAGIKRTLGEWHGILADKAYVSIGYVVAQDHPGVDVQSLTSIADRLMYEDKREYYRSTGKQPR